VGVSGLLHCWRTTRVCYMLRVLFCSLPNRRNIRTHFMRYKRYVCLWLSLNRRNRKAHWLWKKDKNYVAMLLVVSLLTIYILWYLQLNPQQLLIFSVAPLVALILVAVLVLKPEYGERLFKATLTYDAKRKELGVWLRYQKITLVLFFIIVLAFPIIWQHQLVPTQYMAFFVLAFLFGVVALGVLQIVVVIKAGGKWGLLFIVVLALIVFLRMLIRLLLQT